MPPAISVCLPVFNGSRYLREAIESVLDQSFEDFELLISDDNSSDGSLEIISEFARRDSRISYWTNENRCGLFANYNQCLKQASGKYIKPFAQDDLFSREALKTMRQVFEDHAGVVLASCSSKLIGENGESLDDAQVPCPPISIPRSMPIPGARVIQQSLVPVDNFIGEPVRVMFRKFAAGQGFDEKYNHLGDLDYWLRILRNGQYYFLNQDLCSFRRHSASRSWTNARQLLFAPDVLRLADGFGPETEAAGYTRDKLISQCILQLGAHVAFLNEDGQLSEWEIAETGHDDLDEPDLNAAFRRLTFHSLRLLGKHELSEQSIFIDHLAPLVRYRERSLRNILRSRSWRWTRFLREAKLKLKGVSVKEPSLESVETPGSQPLQSQHYLRYMRKKMIAVRASASWRVTSPFRLFKI